MAAAAKRKRLLKLTGITAGLTSVALALLLVGCQSHLIYFPRPYGADDVKLFREAPGGKVIDYRTSDGPQQAYLYSVSNHPERLWILCGGNGTVALDWAEWIRLHGSKEDAWLLFDMPGYGASTGRPNPWSIRRSLKAVVPAAESSLGWQPEESRDRLRFFGHSLGAAVVLTAADEYDIRRGVLLAPFTSTMDMANVMLPVGVPLGWMVWHRFDNEARLKTLAARPGSQVIILHGEQDESLPVWMSRRMAGEFPGLIQYHEIPGGRHNDLGEKVPKEIEAAIREARK